MKHEAPRYSFGPFEFNPLQQQLQTKADCITLPSSLNKLLGLFVARAGELITREEIASLLWTSQGTVDVENGINVAIRRLRTQLATEGTTGEDYIQTVVGSGYRFVATITILTGAEAPPEALPLPAPSAIELTPTDISPPPRANRPWLKPALAAGIVLALVAALLTFSRLRSNAPQAASTASTEAAHPGFQWFPATYREVEDDLTAQAISPTGQYVAWIDRTGFAFQPIHSQQSQALTPPPGLHITHLSWFPDEKHLLASGVRRALTPESRAEVWSVPTDTKPPSLLLTDSAEAIVSPDGLHIAYAHSERAEVWVAAADGSHSRRLIAATPGDTFHGLVWSPGGDRLVVDRNTRLAQTTDSTKGALEQLQLQNRWTYESYDIATGKLLAREPNLRFDSAVLLRDGRLLYPFDSHAPAKTHTEDTKMAVLRTDPATGAILGNPAAPTFLVFPDNAYAARNLTASADGAFLSAIFERRSSDVYEADMRMVDGVPVLSNTRRLTHRTGSSFPTGWTLDGNDLLFDEGDAGHSLIARQHHDGTGMKIMAETGDRDVLGQFTPDGRWILFLHYVGTPSQLESIDRVSASGGPVEVAYKGAAVLDFQCSRSSAGRCVLRELSDKGDVVYSDFDALGGRGKELARTPSVASVLGDWSISPDGTVVAIADHDAMHPGVTLLRLSGRASARALPERLAVEGYGTVLGPCWAVTGNGLFVQTHASSHYLLLYIDLQGKVSQIITSDGPIWAISSRDGKRLAFPGVTPLNRNIWVGQLDTSRARP